MRKNNEQPIHNTGSIDGIIKEKLNTSNSENKSLSSVKNNKIPTSNDVYKTHTINNMNNIDMTNNMDKMDKMDKMNDKISDNVINDLINRYKEKKNTVTDDKDDLLSEQEPEPADPLFDNYGEFSDYVPNKNRVIRNIEDNLEQSDSKDFTYKKKKFTLKSANEIKDQFDASKLLPKQIEEDWFDVVPLLSTKKIEGTGLIHPKMHMGINTIGSSHKYSSHDIRGDIPIPKQNIGPFRISTIEPDTNIKNLCK